MHNRNRAQQAQKLAHYICGQLSVPVKGKPSRPAVFDNTLGFLEQITESA